MKSETQCGERTETETASGEPGQHPSLDQTQERQEEMMCGLRRNEEAW